MGGGGEERTLACPPTTIASAAPLTAGTTANTPGVPSFVVPLKPPWPQYPVYGSAPNTQNLTAPSYHILLLSYSRTNREYVDFNRCCYTVCGNYDRT